MDEQPKIVVRKKSKKYLVMLGDTVLAEFERMYEARSCKEQLLILPDDIRKEVK